jgi:hypothetical protein
VPQAPVRERCAEHGLSYDPRIARGCALCRRAVVADGHEVDPSHALSWLRVCGAVVVVVFAFVLSWKYTSLSYWVESESRAALGLERKPVTDEAGEFDPQLWEQALRYWEPFQYDARDATRVSELAITTYVPRDNLASIEGRVTGRRPNRSEVIDGLRGLNAVLLRYPQRFLQATGFERLVWLCEIVKDGAPARGFAMPPAKTLVLDPTAFDPGIFNHEIFHMLDYRLHGHPGDQPAWNALNPDGATYIGLAAYAAALRQGKGLGHSHPCFMTDYASALPTEDRAETFRVLMSDVVLAAERRASSSVIDAKARYVIAALDQLASGSSVALGLR